MRRIKLAPKGAKPNARLAPKKTIKLKKKPQYKRSKNGRFV